MTQRWHRIALMTSALAPLTLAAAPALAGPNGASVVGGAATVQGQGTASVIVNQSTQNAIINWQTFNIGIGESTKINMPGASSTELDRVTGGLGPSQILGSLSSNGRVFLVNPDGILFGSGAQINVGGLLATTNNISNSDFMAGRYNFNIPGNPSASVVNLGTITAQTGGFAALVAPGVRNAGTITARLGTIALASGNTFTLDMYGDNLITLGLSDSIASQVIDVSTGQPLKSLVSNEGKLKANGGTVTLTAVAARKIVDSVINNSGVIEANTIGTHNGMIVLGGPAVTGKYARAHKQTVTVSGTLSAAGKHKGQSGGTILITGENIAVVGASIDATGQAGGGAVLFGGDWGGGHPNTSLVANASAYLENYAVPTASSVSIDPATTINASATAAGNGGKVIVWSNGATSFAGTILAQGGAQSGNGGFVETSGGTLSFNGTVNTSALNGKTGTWLLDPTDLIIDSTAAATIDSDLTTTSVVLETFSSGPPSGPAGTTGNTNTNGNGDIIVDAPISWSSGNTLTLDAFHAITVNASITVAGAGGLVLDAAPNPVATAAPLISFNNGASVQFTGTPNSGQSLTINSTPYTLLYSMSDVQAINATNGTLALNYALALPLNAAGVASWTPIGTDGNGNILNSGNGFTGTFQGLGNTISNLTINLPLVNDVGLFGYAGTSGLIQNLGLIGGSVSGLSHAGGLIGWNAGSLTVINTYATGTVNGSGNFVGGLIGSDGGPVVNAYATGAVTGGSGSSSVGGLIGQDGGTGAVINSYATGTVTGGSGSSDVGGLIGLNDSTAPVTNSYAAGAVIGGSGSSDVGGLIGQNVGNTNATVTFAYATGAVSGTNDVGGLIGYNNGSVTQTYASGPVTGTSPSTAGGLIGLNDTNGNVNASYWDTTTGLAAGYGSASTGAFTGQGLATSGFATENNFTGFTFGTAPGASGWVIVDTDGSLNNSGGAAGDTRPMLLSEWSATITNAHQLQLMALDLSANYTLATNINLGQALSNASDVWGPNGGAGFVPIGNSSNNFSGAFNGNGNTISGLNISINHFTDEGVGLFGVIGAAGKVENVNLTNATLTANLASTPDNFLAFGLLFGENDGAVANASVTGSINVSVTLAAGDQADVGGLGGFTGGTISQSHSTATVTAASGNGSSANAVLGAGGLVADTGESITGSTASGAVTVSGNALAVAGGLAGLGSGTVSTSSAFGAVSGGGNSFIGGLIGVSFGTIASSNATGAVSGGADSRVGGLVGLAADGCSTCSNPIPTGQVIQFSSATGAVITGANSSAGGLVGQNGGTAMFFGQTFSLTGVPISQSYAIGAVTAGANANAGGLVGLNTGTITGPSWSTPPTACSAAYTCASGVVTVGSEGNAGGLVGENNGSITNAFAIATVTGAAGVGTLDNNGTLTALGGLVGDNTGPISNAFALGTVGSATTSALTVGGLVGNDDALTTGSSGTFGTIAGSFANVTVSAGDNSLAGGLVGSNSYNCGPSNCSSFSYTATIANSNAYGNVTVGASSVAGGLAGSMGSASNSIGNTVATIAGSNAYGAVNGGGTTGNAIIGGLVGFSETTTTISASSAQNPQVISSGPSGFAGGLVGVNNGEIMDSSATTPVSGSATSFVGGLAGITTGTISSSYATGAVTGGTGSSVGGLVGISGNGQGTPPGSQITLSYATGAVSGGVESSVGGLVGENGGTATLLGTTYTLPALQISQSHATGAVTVSANTNLGSSVYVGGLVGYDEIAGAITSSYSTGNVTVTLSGGIPNGVDVSAGGLVGFGLGPIASSNSTGNVSVGGSVAGPATSSVNIQAGGLVGFNSGGAIANSYATGAVTANAANVGCGNQTCLFTDAGGLVGTNLGIIALSDATGAVSVGTNSAAGGVIAGGLVGANGNFGVANPGVSITSSYATGAVNSVFGKLGGLVGENNALIIISQASGAVTSTGIAADCAANGTCDVHAGGLVGENNGAISGAPWTTAPVACAASYACASGNVTVGSSGQGGGLVGSSTTGSVINYAFATGNVTGAAGLPSGNLTMLGGFVGANNGQISNSFATGAVGTSGAAYLLAGGFAANNGGTIASSFAAGPVSAGDNSLVGGLIGLSTGLVTLSQATGAVAGGATSSVGGLVGFAGNGGGGQITQSDATGAVTAGANSESGGLVGQNGGTLALFGMTITVPGVSISQSFASGNVTAGMSANAGGLVGENSGTITGPSWTTAPTTCAAAYTCASGNVTVGTDGQAGGLVGFNSGGTITQTFAIGAATAGDSGIAGGLIGSNSDGTVTLSFAAGPVTGGNGASVAGGLVGENFGGTIGGSDATGAVTVGQVGIAGGLVGDNQPLRVNNSTVLGSITNSYATGAVTAGAFGNAGGLVGDNANTIAQSYATGAVTVGANGTAGGLVGENGNCCDAHGNPIAGATISNSYATGAVFSAGINVELGGLVGQNDPQSVITNAQAYGTVTSTANLPASSTTNCDTNCTYADVGGFAGSNYGTISGTAWSTAPVSCASSLACASGNVAVGSLGSGGGLVGYNEGIITYAFATGNVTGVAGLPDTANGNVFDNTTQIAGFVAENHGQISHSFATGNVGTAGTMWLSAGGFAGSNKGTIDSSFAAGAVVTGDNSTAGGFATGNAPAADAQTCPGCFTGDGLSNAASITNSQAFGNVTIGASSVAAGFSVSGGSDSNSTPGGSFTNVSASGAVEAGHDSIVGGLIGVLFEGGTLANSAANNTLVASSGPNSIVGGIVGVNVGSISDTTSTAPVSGSSDSYIGGITGINFGTVTGSSTDPAISGSGGSNYIGGIAGLNAGSINDSTANVAMTGGSPGYAGGVAGVNGSYSNAPGTIPNSSFPNGTITNSSATGSGFNSQVGNSASPTFTPPPPSWLSGCTDAVCNILAGGSVSSGNNNNGNNGSTSGDNTGTPADLSTTGNFATQQVLQFQQVNFTFNTNTTPPPVLNPTDVTTIITSTGGNGGTGAGGNGGGGNGNGGNGNGGNNGTGSLANGRRGGNGAPPGVRLIDMRVMPLPPGNGLPPPGETRFLPNQVVLQFGAGMTPQQVAAIAQRFGLTIVAQQRIGAFGRTVYTFQFGNGQSVADKIRQIMNAGLNVAAQPNYTYGLTQDPNSQPATLGDPAQYIVQKFHLDAAHRITQGDNVVIALIDSRVDSKQPDFAGRIAESYDAGCGADAPPDAHGTGMAGAIASHVGLLGVAPNASIMAICAFGGTGTPQATSLKIIRGLDYAIQHGAKIVNMSFAGPRDPALAQELQIAREKGVLIIAAAGNAGPKSPPLYPGADPNVMAVTATDEHDRLFAGANQGSYVSVAAPGVNILVPAPNGDVQFTTGTSVASANVSGVAALLLAAKPSRTPEEIRAILVGTATHLGPPGVNTQFGAGLVDPVKALHYVPPVEGRRSAEAAPAVRAQ